VRASSSMMGRTVLTRTESSTEVDAVRYDGLTG